MIHSSPDGADPTGQQIESETNIRVRYGYIVDKSISLVF